MTLSREREHLIVILNAVKNPIGKCAFFEDILRLTRNDNKYALNSNKYTQSGNKYAQNYNKMENNKNFREILIEIRAKNKLSQQELAEILDVSRQTIARWEAGKNNPSTSQIYKLCQAFGLDASELLSASHGKNNNLGSEAESKYETPSTQTENHGKKKNIFRLILIGALIIIFIIGLIITIIYAVKDAMYDSSSTALIISLPQNTPMIVLSIILSILIIILVGIFIFLIRGKRK